MRSSTVQRSAARTPGEARRSVAQRPRRTERGCEPSLTPRLRLGLTIEDTDPVGVMGLEDQGAVLLAAQPAGDVLVAEEQLLVSLLGRRDHQGERQLVLGSLVLEGLVPRPRGLAGRPAEHLDHGRAGLVDGPPGRLAVPALEPGQGQALAVEAAGTLEVLGTDHHPKLPDLHFVLLVLAERVYHTRRKNFKGRELRWAPNWRMAPGSEVEGAALDLQRGPLGSIPLRRGWGGRRSRENMPAPRAVPARRSFPAPRAPYFMKEVFPAAETEGRVSFGAPTATVLIDGTADRARRDGEEGRAREAIDDFGPSGRFFLRPQRGRVSRRSNAGHPPRSSCVGALRLWRRLRRRERPHRTASAHWLHHLPVRGRPAAPAARGRSRHLARAGRRRALLPLGRP